jgi:molybdopterin/thiamine biosynthesis adenylyltransferase
VLIVSTKASIESTRELHPTDNPAPRDEEQPWSYGEAFSRNLGLINAAEQDRLRASRVAVAGLGGVGGIDLVALARLGIGNFTIADPDVFDVSNTNRQYGAMRSTQGRSKADVMRAIIHDINPEATIRVLREPIGPANADVFLDGANVLVDGIDAFEIGLRRLLFRKARERGIHALGAGPVGFSTVWVIFGPRGMSFDRYFDLSDAMDHVEQFVAYVLGMAPASIQRRYMDLAFLDVARHRGPSVGLACHLASGVVAAEVAKILLGRGRVHLAPVYHQFDAYVGRYVRRRLVGGNRHPYQRFKRRWLVNYIRRRLRRTQAGAPNARHAHEAESWRAASGYVLGEGRFDAAG